MKMTMTIALASAILAPSAFADPTVFNMELGRTTESEVKSMYSVQHSGTNKYTNGNMYEIHSSEINFEGLQEVSTIFNSEGTLVAVLAKFPKGKFEYLNQIMSQKYKRVRHEVPFVGNKSATYLDGETEITLSAPHLSFEMSMNYIHLELKREYERQVADERNQQKKNESQQL